MIVDRAFNEKEKAMLRAAAQKSSWRVNERWRAPVFVDPPFVAMRCLYSFWHYTRSIARPSRDRFFVDVEVLSHQLRRRMRKPV